MNANETIDNQCSACQGTPPYHDNEIPYVNDPKGVGVTCKECGHFYEFPTASYAYNGTVMEPDPLLNYYVYLENWDCALSRVSIAPQEAKYRDDCGFSPLWKACVSPEAPLALVHALIEADPTAVVNNDNEGDCCPLEAALLYLPPNLHRYKVLKALVSKNDEVLRCWGQESYCSIMAKFGREWQQHFQNVAELPGRADLNLREYKTDTIQIGVLPHVFKEFSLLVKADFHGGWVEDILTNEPILHAIAGCRDPYINSKSDTGFLALCMRMFPGQLLQNGDTPLHGAVSTLNRDKEDYCGYDPHELLDWNEDLAGEKYHFLESLCSHVEKEPSFKNFLKSCQCNKGMRHQYLGCTCPPSSESVDCEEAGSSSGDNEDKADCRLCYGKFVNDIQWDKWDLDTCTRVKACTCSEKYTRHCDMIEAKREKCGPCVEAYNYWHAKMHDEHRFDKCAVIEKLLQACLEATSCRNSQGRLPIHIAVGEGGKRWEGGLKMLVEAYPEGVGMKDPTNGLYPFMASAAASDLDACFELICFRPDVLGYRNGEKTKKATRQSTGKRQREE